MTRIVAIGECMVEMAPIGAAVNFKMGFAGDTMNTAWYLRSLLNGADSVDYCTAVGTDAVSNQMVAFLYDAGIGTGHVFRRPEKSVGLYMIQLNEGERSFSYWRGDSAARTLAANPTALTHALAGANIAYFSGITLAILSDVDRQSLLAVLRDFRTGGGTVVFDPNLRPRLWSDMDDMLSAVMEAASVSDIVLPSYEDEAIWFGDATPADTVQRYQTVGATTIIVKNGAGRITALSDGRLSEHPTTTVSSIVDTTAAGDSFNAGFLASRIAGEPITVSIEAGASLSAKVIQSHGALISV